MFVHPQIDPVAITIGPLSIHWYGLMYLLGFTFFVLLGRYRIKHNPHSAFTYEMLDDALFYGMLGVILGGRLGHVLFYQFGYYLEHPLHIFAIWEGGMSFHGGLLGVVIAVWLFCRKNKLPFLSVADLVCAFAPMGLFFGRLANFVNGELWGRVTDVPWAMIFPRGGPLPRHPSQLYEAALEGILLFIIVQIALRVFRAQNRPGLISGIFFLGYGTFRFISEFFREPDAPFLGPVSMGMALSIPVWLGAAALIAIAFKPKNERAR